MKMTSANCPYKNVYGHSTLGENLFENNLIQLLLYSVKLHSEWYPFLFPH